ncbi:unnamed protein product, partial [Allacma fusca]
LIYPRGCKENEVTTGINLQSLYLVATRQNIWLSCSGVCSESLPKLHIDIFKMIAEVFLTLALLSALLVLYLRWNHGTLEKLGIPVVKTHFLLGSQSSFTEVFGPERDLEWFQAHGKIYGVYCGRQPQIHIVDPDIVRQIYITDFDKFRNHKFHAGVAGSPVLGEMLDFLTGTNNCTCKI